MKKYIVQQLSKRRMYDVAEILHEAQMLDCLITDFYELKSGSLFANFLPNNFIKTLSKYKNTKIPRELVKENITAGVNFRLLQKVYQKNFFAYQEGSKMLAKLSRIEIGKNKANAVYSFDVTALEFFRIASKRDYYSVLEQCVAPRKAQIEMYNLFAEQYGANYTNEIENCKRLQEREEEEWVLSNKIVAPSDFVVNKLIEAGCQKDKIVKVNYGFSVGRNILDQSNFEKKNENEDFTILFVGNSSLRKGLQDIVKIAERIKNNKIKFRIAGDLENKTVEQLGIAKTSNIKLLGKLEKDKLYREYENANAFILPSYLEGSAMVILEALNFSLPILTTFESGSNIVDGVNGFVTKAGNINYFVQRINELYDNKDLRLLISNNAILLAKNHSTLNYSKDLITELI
ncbi:glycosyltransferase family 4 protein [uncultured Chryseobacterium sp.]|uniref:glycosyltransferase family 4 protein n=1 Tax=uncultured Chryseobacterium sp. TaxID=259322 RepID=UPI002613414D|nr:glycosyltransferase family 4 protein [uncultured Chryseobacterium sp.]